jgi:chromosome partitioning protein
MKVISFTIFKGGTGKTTSSVNTAVALAQQGKRVLLVDLDQQASATRYLGIDPESPPSLHQVFMGTRSTASAVRKITSLQ